jgi:hypothetical protein
MVRPQGVYEIEFNARSGINYQDVSGWVVVMHSRHVAQAVDTQGSWCVVGIGEGKGMHVRDRVNLASNIN